MAFSFGKIWVMRKSKGFTLAELLIVVAIIAVLVAISIPVFADQLHKAKVASDMSNVRSYYSKLQYDFIQTEVYDDTKENEYGKPGLTAFEIDGNTINLTVGYLWIAPEYDDNTAVNKKIIGYNFLYSCKDGDHILKLPED